MSAGDYTTNSLSWQLRQTLQRLSEGWEYQLSRFDMTPPEIPTGTWPEGVGRGLFWLLLTTLALWLGWLLYRAIEAALRQRILSSPVTPAPSQPSHSPQHWWRLAHGEAQAGRYAEACRALYQGALQQLHHTQHLSSDPSRTDGEYLQALTDMGPSRPYQLLIRTHERLQFGNAVITAEIFQRCRRAYQDIQKS